MKSTSFVLNTLVLAATALAADFATFPKVPKTYTINGFADPVYDAIPECAKECVSFENPTICPTFDSGCFCVMTNWNALVAECLVKNCAGDDIVQATSAITSMCNRVGANTWAMPASYSDALEQAAIKEVEVETTAEETVAAPTAAETTPENTPEPTAEETTEQTTPAPSTAAPVSDAEETSDAPQSAAPESAAGPSSSASDVTPPLVETANMAVRGAVGAIGLVAALPFLL